MPIRQYSDASLNETRLARSDSHSGIARDRDNIGQIEKAGLSVWRLSEDDHSNRKKQKGNSKPMHEDLPLMSGLTTQVNRPSRGPDDCSGREI
jgi:hypothetical protein